MRFTLQIDLNLDRQDQVYSQLAEYIHTALVEDPRDAELTIAVGDKGEVRDEYGLIIGIWQVVDI